MCDSDSLVPTDATQALALAVKADSDGALALQQQEHEEHEALVLFDPDGNKKRRKQGQGPAKKGKRFGLPEDKPFKPPTFLDLPVMTPKDVDQFLREQRLEELQQRLELHILEDVEPDIRPPSPPPIYDSNGNRLNTRDVRIRKAMTTEFNRLVRYMMKNLEDYEPPSGWKPGKLVKKIIIPVEKYPGAPFTGVIIGARGINHKHLQERTGCMIFVRGKEMGASHQSEEEAAMPMHVHIEGDTEEQIEVAEKLIKPLLNPETPEFEYARTHGMSQLAKVNGFTVSRSEHRCGVCGAIGHLGFECPETETYAYKMANVKCTICGDKGHVASDCKQALEKHKRENVDWKEEAEKRQQAEEDYANLMSELGVDPGIRKESPAKPEVNPPEADPPVPSPAPPTPPTMPDKATVKMVPVPPAVTPGLQLAPIPPNPSLPAPRSWVPAGKPVTPTPPKPPPKPRPPAVSSTAPAPGRAQPRPRGPPHWQGRPNRPYAAVRAVHMEAPAPLRRSPPIVADPDADRSIQCPVELVEKLTDDGGKELWDMMQETGARIGVSGTTILVAGSHEARENAKCHLRAWLDVNSRMLGLVNGSGFPPLGFPPGVPPPMQGGALIHEVLPTTGFPPSGFPAGGVPHAAFPPGFPPVSNPVASMPLPPQGGCAVNALVRMTADAWDEL
mmetsp:Transcript_32912/g.60221  ORF Transcript_32912/g.60221 Transcript_32912/m.60221 type:complete len:672 (+) Transcript_32912:213-2228(+)